jgi:hypothetical protein
MTVESRMILWKVGNRLTDYVALWYEDHSKKYNHCSLLPFADIHIFLQFWSLRAKPNNPVGITVFLDWKLQNMA